MINQDGVITTISVVKDVMDDPVLIRKLLLRGWEIVGIDRFGCFYLHRKILLNDSTVGLLKIIKSYADKLSNLEDVVNYSIKLSSGAFDISLCELFFDIRSLIRLSEKINFTKYGDKSMIDEFNDLINTKFKKYIYD